MTTGEKISKYWADRRKRGDFKTTGPYAHRPQGKWKTRKILGIRVRWKWVPA